MQLKCVPNARVIDPVDELFHLETHISPRVNGSLSTLSAYKHVHNVASICHIGAGKMKKPTSTRIHLVVTMNVQQRNPKKGHTHILFKSEESQIMHIFSPECTTDTCREFWISETASDKYTHTEVNMSPHANKAPVKLFYLTIWWVWHVYWTS